jgi:hypothetical protein
MKKRGIVTWAAFSGMCVIGLSAAVAGVGSSGAPKEGVVRVEQASTDPKDVCHAHKTLLEAARAKGANDGSDLENAIEDGRHAFNNRKLDGLGANGRACADCHMASENFQLTPAIAEARFTALQACRTKQADADDPLFRPIDADDFRINGQAASDFSTLRNHGLIRISLPLPSTIRLVDPVTNEVSNETVADVWRSVPSVRNVKLTGNDGVNPTWFRGPNQRGGYQLDARQGTLQDQALGALFAHAEIQTPPAQSFLDNVAIFQNNQFSPGVRAISDALDQGLPPPVHPADSDLTPLEADGKVTFQRACAHCHGGNGLTTPSSDPPTQLRYFNIFTSCPRPPSFPEGPCTALAHTIRTYEVTITETIPLALCPLPPIPAGCGPAPAPACETACVPGVKLRRTTSDPGRALLTGYIGGRGAFEDWERFDMAPLRGISQTAPYFINNSAKTLEEVLDHYDHVFAHLIAITPPGACPPALSTPGNCMDRPPRPEERAGLLAFLRKL